MQEPPIFGGALIASSRRAQSEKEGRGQTPAPLFLSAGCRAFEGDPVSSVVRNGYLEVLTTLIHSHF
jgi:hypothetical protein